MYWKQLRGSTTPNKTVLRFSQDRFNSSSFFSVYQNTKEKSRGHLFRWQIGPLQAEGEKATSHMEMGVLPGAVAVGPLVDMCFCWWDPRLACQHVHEWVLGTTCSSSSCVLTKGGGPEGIAGHVASWGPLPRWPCKHKYKHNAVECRMTTGIYCDHAEWIFQVIPLTGAWPVPASPTLGSLPAVCLHVLIFIFTLFFKMHWVWIQTNHQVGS